MRLSQAENQTRRHLLQQPAQPARVPSLKIITAEQALISCSHRMLLEKEYDACCLATD